MAHQKLKVLMLGWEFPPQITGGLGTACEGLTYSLAKHDLMIHFFMPVLCGNEHAPHMFLYDVKHGVTQLNANIFSASMTRHLEETLLFYKISSFLSPYLRPDTKIDDLAISQSQKEFLKSMGKNELFSYKKSQNKTEFHKIEHTYGHRIFEEVDAYSRRTVTLACEIDFDIIHAHDWMTFPAALALKHATGKPIILHVHSLESDRSGACKNESISHIEGTALHQADAVITVSQYTRQKVIEDFGVAPEKIHVIHNGLRERNRVSNHKKENGCYRVLFLGRVTFQKGPDYFVEAAIKVLKILPNTEFVLAGSGDMLEPLRERIRQAGCESNFVLPGFLRGNDVDDMLASADLYVMPSVSEPFGISALEALYYDIPIIISHQSGVSEVIRHALKADFWDIDELADLITGALKYPELRRDMLQMAKQELKRLTWDNSARHVVDLYHSVLHRKKFA